MLRKREQIKKNNWDEMPYVTVALTSEAWTFNCSETDNIAARDMRME